MDAQSSRMGFQQQGGCHCSAVRRVAVSAGGEAGVAERLPGRGCVWQPASQLSATQPLPTVPCSTACNQDSSLQDWLHHFLEAISWRDTQCSSNNNCNN